MAQGIGQITFEELSSDLQQIIGSGGTGEGSAQAILSLSDIGLVDADFSPTDLGDNCLKIVKAMGVNKILNCFLDRDAEPNLSASINTKTNLPDGLLTVRTSENELVPNQFYYYPNQSTAVYYWSFDNELRYAGKLYHEGHKPTPEEIGAITQEDIDKVNAHLLTNTINTETESVYTMPIDIQYNCSYIIKTEQSPNAAHTNIKIRTNLGDCILKVANTDTPPTMRNAGFNDFNAGLQTTLVYFCTKDDVNYCIITSMPYRAIGSVLTLDDLGFINEDFSETDANLNIKKIIDRMGKYRQLTELLDYNRFANLYRSLERHFNLTWSGCTFTMSTTDSSKAANPIYIYPNEEVDIYYMTYDNTLKEGRNLKGDMLKLSDLKFVNEDFSVDDLSGNIKKIIDKMGPYKHLLGVPFDDANRLSNLDKSISNYLGLRIGIDAWWQIEITTSRDGLLPNIIDIYGNSSRFYFFRLHWDNELIFIGKMTFEITDLVQEGTMLKNGWKRYPGHQEVRLTKAASMVHLTGYVTVGKVDGGTTIIEMPGSYRPSVPVAIDLPQIQLRVGVDGKLTVYSSNIPQGSRMSLNGISWIVR